MSIQRLKEKDLPKKTRHKPARFEKTPEWAVLRRELERGLKPGEVIQIGLSDEDKKKYRIRNRVTVARFIKKYLAVRKLPYTVSTSRTETLPSGHGTDFIRVHGV